MFSDFWFHFDLEAEDAELGGLLAHGVTCALDFIWFPAALEFWDHVSSWTYCSFSLPTSKFDSLIHLVDLSADLFTDFINKFLITFVEISFQTLPSDTNIAFPFVITSHFSMEI